MATTRPDIDRLIAAVDALGTAFGDLAIETFTADSLRQASIQATRAANMIDGVRADLARKARDLQPAGAPAAVTSGRTLDPHGQRSNKATEQDSSRSELFDSLPSLGDATRRGDLSGGYADAVNQATTRLSSDERAAFLHQHRDRLSAAALTMGLHEYRVHVRGLVDDHDRARELERFHQQRADRTANLWTDHATGMTKLFAQFDPETGARVRKAVDEEIDRLHRAARDNPNDQRTHQQLVADAIANLILGARSSGRSRTELVVLVDLQTLLDDMKPGADPVDTTAVDTTANPPGDPLVNEPAGPETQPGRCCETSDGTRLPVETVRHLACQADIIPAVLNGDGVVVDLGRAHRLANNDQRRQLRIMYPTCAFNDCNTTFDRCEIHHITPFGPPSNGTTDIDKLIPTCQRHHHLIHDHHLHLTLDPNTRTLTVTHPDGHQQHHPHLDRRRRTTANPGPLPHTA
ncbi:HNH endonuclease signature motif containing protein [Desertimonas flava]|uniref:HNH endonuclease signature motif containing protein n=1 Tax=Desertimonas flava TaxID=2064846 RepID=UPI000E3536AC|nr:HNH endonuclease signature motif containing protein [Desertimonas flava]